MVVAPWVIYAMWAAVALAFAAAAYTYYQSRKMTKKNRPAPSQLDGTIADEGQSFSDIAGSPHLYGCITWKGNESTEAIKRKSGK